MAEHVHKERYALLVPQVCPPKEVQVVAAGEWLREGREFQQNPSHGWLMLVVAVYGGNVVGDGGHQ